MQNFVEKYSQLIDMIDNNCHFSEIVRESEFSKSEVLLAIYKLISNDLRLPYHIRYNLIQEYLNNFTFANLGGKKTIIISDTHLASVYENLNYFNKVEEFIKKNNINYLLHGGDIGDGMVEGDKKYYNYDQQVSHIMDVYPEFCDCHQYILGGNHDRRYKDKNMDLLKLLEQKENIESVGYYQAYFKLFDKNISFEHHSLMNKCEYIDVDFSILGHAHNLCFKNNKIKLYPLCDCFMNKANEHAGFVLMDSKKIKNGVLLTFDCYNIDEESIRRVTTKEYILKKHS